MQSASFDFMSEVECLTAYLPGVANALNILRDELDMNLRIHQRSTKGMEYYLSISSAMGPALMELDRIRAGLDAAIEAAYGQKKGGQNDN